jgi:hypothetical protein
MEKENQDIGERCGAEGEVAAFIEKYLNFSLKVPCSSR